MNKIEELYKRAVEGIKDEWFNPKSDEWFNHIVSLPTQLQVVYLVSILDTQVNNGGFSQYFINGYGQFSKETIWALGKIKAAKFAELLQIAFDEVNSEKLELSVFRKKLLLGEIDELYQSNALIEKLDTLTEKYYVNTEDLELLLLKYIAEF
jgi:hypothetical protein